MILIRISIYLHFCTENPITARLVNAEWSKCLVQFPSFTHYIKIDKTSYTDSKKKSNLV